MIVLLKKLTIRTLNGDDNPSVSVKLIERFKFSSLTHESESFPVTAPVVLNFAVEVKYPIVDSLEFEIKIISPIYGSHCLATASIPSPIELPSKRRLTFETSLPANCPVLDLEFSPLKPPISPDGRISGNFPISNFLSISIFSEKVPLLSVIHISGDRQIVNYSRARFNYLPNVHISEKIILFQLAQFSGFWKDFVWAIEFTETSSVTFVLRTGSEANIIAIETFHPTGKGLFIPFQLSFSSASEVTAIRIAKFFPQFQLSDLSDKFDHILSRLDFHVLHVPQFLHFDDHTAIFETSQPLLIVLDHEIPGKLDLSLASIRNSGGIDSTCFYNTKAILNKAIQWNQSEIDGSNQTGLINFSGIPVSARIQYVLVLLSHSKSGAPLSEFGKITLQMKFEGSGKRLLQLPLELGSASGFFVGSFEKIEENKWKFVYFGVECSSWLPPSIAKMAVKVVRPVDEEVVWHD
jgi:hypothetical protein